MAADQKLQFSEIHSLNDDYLYVEDLLARSFPSHELRPRSDLRALPGGEPDFHPTLITYEGRRAGALNWWSLGAFNFCEHFAIEPGLRGQGLGAEAFRAFMAQGPALLEAEHPETESAARRIRFYERLGLCAWKDVPYAQPPYAARFQPCPMLLMADPSLSREDSAKIISLIYKRVYGREC